MTSTNNSFQIPNSILEAITENDAKKLKRRIRSKTDDERTEFLRISILLESLDCASMLVEDGVSLARLKNRDAPTFVPHLLDKSGKKFIEAFELCQVDARVLGESLLKSAVSAKNLEVVKYLVGKGVLPFDHRSETLLLCMRSDSVAILKFLLSQAESPKHISKVYELALKAAITNNSLECLKVVLEDIQSYSKIPVAEVFSNGCNAQKETSEYIRDTFSELVTPKTAELAYLFFARHNYLQNARKILEEFDVRDKVILQGYKNAVSSVRNAESDDLQEFRQVIRQMRLSDESRKSFYIRTFNLFTHNFSALKNDRVLCRILEDIQVPKELHESDEISHSRSKLSNLFKFLSKSSANFSNQTQLLEAYENLQIRELILKELVQSDDELQNLLTATKSKKARRL